MAKWRKDELRLKQGHGWKAKPGYQIFVADRGLVRFDVPRGWVLEAEDNTFKFHDRQPPDDNCVLQATIMRLPPDIALYRIPLAQMLSEALAGVHAEVLSAGDIVHITRPDLELAWTEHRLMDPGEHREACSRSCLVRGAGVQVFITLDYWPEDARRLAPAWDELLRSLRLGEYVDDPTQGPRR